MRYRLPGISFALPDGAVDQSVIVLTLPAAEDTPFTVIVMRHSLPDGKTLTEFVVDDVMARERNGEDYAMLWKKTYRHEGSPGFILAGTLVGGVTHERRLYLASDGTVFTVTARMQGKFASAQLDSLNGFVKTFRVSGISGDTSPDGQPTPEQGEGIIP